VFFVLEELMLIPVKLLFLLLGDCFLVVLFVAIDSCHLCANTACLKLLRKRMSSALYAKSGGTQRQKSLHIWRSAWQLHRQVVWMAVMEEEGVMAVMEEERITAVMEGKGITALMEGEGNAAVVEGEENAAVMEGEVDTMMMVVTNQYRT
jgi:hypothetical protein